MKIIWAPFVDTYYIPSFGRRKTWLVPVQLLTGLVMILGAGSVGFWLKEQEFAHPLPHTSPSPLLPADGVSVTLDGLGPPPPDAQAFLHPPVDIYPLTLFFFFLYFLMATQDIAVDGWALTMLSRESVGYASIANAIGQSFGVFVANQGFLALSDDLWCSRFLGTAPLVSLSSFMVFWGYTFIATTALVCFFKKEEDSPEEALGITDTVRQIAAIAKLRNVLTFLGVLLSCRAAFAPMDAAFIFKLQEYGLPKSDLTTLAPLLLATSLLFPALTSSVVARQPLRALVVGVSCKLAVVLLLWGIFQATASIYAHSSNRAEVVPPPLYYTSLVVAMVCNECASNLVFISCMAFFSKVSDPSIGGSYMTLLNTVANLGAKWPAVLSLYLLPKLTLTAAAAGGSASAAAMHSSDTIQLDGLTVLTGAGLLGGVVWLLTMRPVLQSLQALPQADWMVDASSKSF